ncbi:hypothetical protein PPERSA_12683 [Pseudocohnilembus persalinus]|uniref:EF-hand domain-containing protein n=1 Tax=Pseudocohnilembus persalinus TaxID=266149 RepID=A0A0V0QN90_PSEPJ|nr:hypothetical protein PPERSA_12683 [Pseudocohnilembus persalinus]|eukprot:KRX03553.1 hypothetical protein PPERSA_12683 [Pseudocohnilembus persalinus]
MSMDEIKNNKIENQNNRREILKFTIEIGQGRKGSIHIFEGDDPLTLAQQFCQKHNLNDKVIDVLVQNIEENLETVYNQQDEDDQQHQYEQGQDEAIDYDQNALDGQEQEQEQEQQLQNNDYENAEFRNNNNHFIQNQRDNFQQWQQQAIKNIQYKQQESQQIDLDQKNQEKEEEEGEEEKPEQYSGSQQWIENDQQKYEEEYYNSQTQEEQQFEEQNQESVFNQQKQLSNYQNSQSSYQQLSQSQSVKNQYSQKELQNCSPVQNSNSNRKNYNVLKEIQDFNRQQLNESTKQLKNKIFKGIKQEAEQNRQVINSEKNEQFQSLSNSQFQSQNGQLQSQDEQLYNQNDQINYSSQQNKYYTKRSKFHDVPLTLHQNKENDLFYAGQVLNRQSIQNGKIIQNKKDIFNQNTFTDRYIGHQSKQIRNNSALKQNMENSIYNSVNIKNKQNKQNQSQSNQKDYQTIYYKKQNDNKQIDPHTLPVHERLFQQAQKKKIELQKKQQEAIKREEKKIVKRSHSLYQGNSEQKQNNYFSGNKQFQHLYMQQNESKIYESNSNFKEFNSGARLYYRGVKQQEQKQKQIDSFKQKREEQENSQCTYHPKINQISAAIASQIRNEPVGEYLNKVARIQQDRRERAKSYKQDAEIAKCSFHPTINEISRQISTEKSKLFAKQIMKPNVDRFELLFEDYKHKMERQKSKDKLQQDQQCTFHPQINKLSQELTMNQDFFDRQQQYEIRKNENQDRIQRQFMGSSGGKPFYPTTGRGPKKRDNSVSVFDKLYQQKLKKDEVKLEQDSSVLYSNQNQTGQKLKNQYDSSSTTNRMQNQKSVEKLKNNKNNVFQVNPQSQKLVEERKIQKIREIFVTLDNDGDGIISAQNIDISNLQPEILEIFSPLLIEMEELEQELNQEEFEDAALRLIQ